MRISARNQIKGTVVEVKKGATTSHVRVDIGNGQIVTSSITNEAVDDLGIKAKGDVTVVIKGLRRHDCGGLIMRAPLIARIGACSEPHPPWRRKNRAAATSSNGRSTASARR